MLSVSYYFKKNQYDEKKDGTVYLLIREHGMRSYLRMFKIPPTCWNGFTVVKHKKANLYNKILWSKKIKLEDTIEKMQLTDQLIGKTTSEKVKTALEQLGLSEEGDNTRQAAKKLFLNYFEQQCERKHNPGTKKVYETTLRKLKAFCQETGQKQNKLTFKDVNRNWIEDFQQFCLRTERQSTTSIHLRNIRTVFNAAREDNITSYYPFNKFKIKTSISKDKHIPLEKLRMLLNSKCNNSGEQMAQDIFKLSYMLIGINPIDLYNANEINADGRLEYDRTKTGTFYSVKIEPEMLRIIEKYKGETHLLCLKEKYPNYKTLFHNMVRSLKRIGLTYKNGKKSTGDAIISDISFGAARTSWATIAQTELNAPRELIAAALGHKTVDVTTTYLRTLWTQKIDELNKRMINIIAE